MQTRLTVLQILRLLNHLLDIRRQQLPYINTYIIDTYIMDTNIIDICLIDTYIMDTYIIDICLIDVCIKDTLIWASEIHAS